MIRRRLAALLAVGLVLAACGSGGDDPPAATDGPATTRATTTPTPTTTAAPETTTTTTEAPLPVPAALQDFGYPVSDDWVVETVVADVDSGTGGLALDADGVMYVGDFGQPDTQGDVVNRITPDGIVEPYSSDEGMRQLTSTSFGPDGTLFQSSFGSDEVYAIDTAGSATVLTSEIRSPTGLVATGDGSILVSSFSLGKIYEVLPDGTTTEWASSRRFDGINSLSMGPDGTVYTADFRGSSIFALAPEGEVTKLHEFPESTSHVTYHDGSLFVTSRTGYVVFRYDLETEEVEIIAGNGEPGDRDGRGTESSFGSPNAIRVGPDGSLYMNHGDDANAWPVTIRRLTYDP